MPTNRYMRQQSRVLWLALVILTLSVAPRAAPARAAAPAPAPMELTLAQALALMPDTPAMRAAGVWYNDYALAERAYGLTATMVITDARILQSYFQATQPLRPGMETGVAELVSGHWRQVYGYDLFQLTADIYSNSGGNCPVGSNYPLAMAAGNLDAASIGHVLATGGYSHAATDQAGFFHRTSLLLTGSRNAIMNALLLEPRRLIAGARPCDVAHAAQLLEQGSATLGRDPGYAALAAALGPVQGAYLAANVAPPPFALAPFPPPSGGHRGPALHPFGLYALAYQELHQGERYVELALGYARRADALADIPTLDARLQREALSIYDAPWRSLMAGPPSLIARGNVLVVRLRLRPTTPATLWQDVVAEHALSLLSR